MTRILPALLALLLVATGPALAITSPDEMLKDPALEARARALGKELRCLVCQNQSIDDSNADLARDLRRLVRERILAGDSDQQVLDFLTQRYGDFVLLKPPVKPVTWLLWFGPPAVLLLGAGLAVAFFRGRAGPSAEPELDPAERERLQRLLAENGGTGQP
ncbi:cytochrome c-type biogenesis protein [Benzoatithermus flavus]|uniref:Cytochrome c-type biogenesis protein n=1 Tax=Benzoatithermus flavus TaxID=3108223 RepID=A0ABU8XX27_9PROT